MTFAVGDCVIFEATGRRRSDFGETRPTRRGVIYAVLRGGPDSRYMVRWDVGAITVHSRGDGELRPDPTHPKRRPAGRTR